MADTFHKGGTEVEQILGWGTAGGLGILLAGLGVFFWGLQFTRREWWSKREPTSKSKKDEPKS